MRHIIFLMAKSQRVVMSILASEYQSLIVRVKELEETVAELKRDNEEKAKIIAEQAKQIEELKAKLARYENPHTPPSAERYKKESKSRNPQKRHSAPNGRHRGATRPTPEPDKMVEVTADQCDHCDCGHSVQSSQV